MNRLLPTCLIALVFTTPVQAQDFYPTAILAFQERGTFVKDYGSKVVDLMFAALVVDPEIYLVDREELSAALKEQELSVSGLVKASEANQVGQLTGAKVLVTGSVVGVDNSIYLVAKVIGTETGRVAGASVKGQLSDELGPLVEQLAAKVAKTIKEQAESLVAKPVVRTDRIAALNDRLAGAKRPTVMISIPERHVGQTTLDPAAATEISLICEQTGFIVYDSGEAAVGKADILIRGEGFSEFAGRLGDLASVKARLEVKAIDRKSGQVLATDRQTCVHVDLSEQIAGKSALAAAAADIAERLLPKLVSQQGGKK